MAFPTAASESKVTVDRTLAWVFPFWRNWCGALWMTRESVCTAVEATGSIHNLHVFETSPIDLRPPVALALHLHQSGTGLTSSPGGQALLHQLHWPYFTGLVLALHLHQSGTGSPGGQALLHRPVLALHLHQVDW